MKQITNLSWSVVATLLVVSTVYFLVAGTLLQSDNANIAFIEQEQRGLSDYSNALSLYFKLYETGAVEPVKNGLLQSEKANYPSAWDEAKTAVAAATGTADVARVLRKLIRSIGDRSNLILDPQLTSYYAVDILFNQMPRLLQRVSDNNNDAVLTNAIEALDYAAQIITSVHGSDVLLQSITTFKTDWRAAQDPSPSGDVHMSMLEHGYGVAQAARQILDYELQRRLAKQRAHRVLAVAVILGVYLALAVLTVFSVRNYVYRREIQSARERQQLTEQLAVKNDELENFTYVAAHDMKEPVRTMRCFAALLKEETKIDRDPAAKKYLDVIDSAAARTERMINDLLSYAKLGRDTLRFEECETAAEVLAVLQDLKLLIETTHASVTIGPMPTLPTVPTLFRRVIQNLVDNAIHYRRQDTPPVIRIDAVREPQGWIFGVHDNGIGIASEHAKVVFEPFRRLDHHINEGGQGIGLTSCKKMVERLGGRIWVTSELEKGASFWIYLPNSQPDAVDAA